MTEDGATQVTDGRLHRDWSDLGAMVARAARRATAMHLVESAEALAGGADVGQISVHRIRDAARTAEGDRAGSLKRGSSWDGRA